MLKGGDALSEEEGHWEYILIDGKLYRKWVNKRGNVVRTEPM